MCGLGVRSSRRSPSAVATAARTASSQASRPARRSPTEHPSRRRWRPISPGRRSSPRPRTTHLPRSCATSCSPQAPAEDAVGRSRSTRSTRDRSSAPSSTSKRRMQWGQDELARVASRRWSRPPIGCEPGASVREAMRHLDTDPARQPARHRRAAAPGCRASPTRRSPNSVRPTSTFPSRSGRSNAASPRRIRAASTTPARATTSAVPAGCGGRCPTASTSSRPGAN